MSICKDALLLPFSLFSQRETSEEKVYSPGLDVGLLESEVQEKTEQSQQLRDQILKQQEALSRARQSLRDTSRAAGSKVQRVLGAPPFLFTPFYLLIHKKSARF